MSPQTNVRRDRTLFRLGAALAVLIAITVVADLVRGTGGAAWLFGAAGVAAEADTEPVAVDPGDFVFRGATVFDGQTFLEATDVLVRDGVIVDIGTDLDAAGAREIDGAGRTLLPGLIDAHTHTWGEALRSALTMGVTTVLDMFTEPGYAAQMRAQQVAGEANGRADLLSSGVLVTAPGGHGTEYGMTIPTLERASDAAAFVRDRVEEGSDFIKIVVDDGSLGRPFSSLDLETVAAVIEAAHALDKLAVVHVSDQDDAVAVVEAGADGIVHVFYDSVATDETVALFRERGAFVVPTLAVIESVSGGAGGSALLADERVAPFVLPVDRANLETSFPGGADRAAILERALESVRRLHAGGVTILAGTDSPNPGTAHGYSMHRELELLARAGLAPEELLAAATALPARAFGLDDRGVIRAGVRADLLLVAGDPREDVTTTRSIDGVWKAGDFFDREAVRRAVEAASAGPDLGSGLISDFDEGEITSLVGSGWQMSTDQMMGGSSTGAMKVVEGGADDSDYALEVSGTLAVGSQYAWAGPMLTPGTQPFAPTDLSSRSAVSFWLQGDGTVAVMIFAQSAGQEPVVLPLEASPEWSLHVLPFEDFPGVDPTGIQAIMFSPTEGGEFTFRLDEVSLR